MAEAALGRTAARAAEFDDGAVRRAVAAALDEGVLVLDDNGVIIGANEAATRILGMPAWALDGHSPRDARWLLHPDGTPVAPDEHPAMVTLATGDPAELVMKVHRQDMSAVWLRIRTEPLFEEGDPRPSGVVGILTDVTEVVDARETLAAVERIATIASWRWDFGLPMVEWSPELNRMFGLDEGDASIGLPAIDDVLHPDDVAVVSEVRELALRAHEPFQFEARIVRSDGSERVVVSRGEPIVGPEQALIGYRGTVQDVTQERERESRLREREEQLRALIDSSPDSIVRIDRELRHVDLNQAVLDQAGVPADYLLGRSVRNLGFDDALTGVWVDELTAVFETGEARMYEYEIPLPQGPRWFESRAAPEFGPTGEVEHVVIVSRDVTVRHGVDEALAHQATHDGLTGLPNRRVLLDTLDELTAREPAARFAVLELDVDRFKLVNDLLGHPAGDALLVAFAARLRGAVREGDLLTRLGGDEFVIVAHRIEGREDAARVAERVQRALREPITVQGQELRPSASIGISLPGAGDVPAAELLSRADAAMYLAKERGRARYEFFDDELRARVAERLSVETALRRALSNDELVVHYQPEVSLSTGEIIGVEALVRWERPDHGLLSAAEFVPVAEDTGLIVELGGRVLARAALDAARWHAQHPDRPFVVRVNLSARQLADPDLIDEVRAVLTDIELPDGMLWFELTETVLMSDTPLVRANVSALRRLGLPIAIDDFGSGYSSLAYLKRLPAAAIKIDREFIEHLPASVEDMAIVKAIVVLGHTIGAVVIAEGIETEEQREALLELGCTRAQGFLFGRAVPAEEIDELLAAAVPTT